MPTQMDFFELTILEPVQQIKDNISYSAITGDLSSSQNRICSNEMMSTDAENLIHSLAPSLNSENLECLDTFNSINYDGEDLLDDLNIESVVLNQRNTRPTRYPIEFQKNNLHLMRGNTLYSQNGGQVYTNNYQQNQVQVVQNSHEQEFNLDSPMAHYSDANSNESCDEEKLQGDTRKRCKNRRNAWGNMSYADLIAQAIISSPKQRLTLSEIYCWMVDNVPYFSDKGDSTSSAGWKNSIRHNLSLHNRFMRVQNKQVGKSSLWIMNPKATRSPNPRLQAITKKLIDKKRRDAKKSFEMQSSTSIIGNKKSIGRTFITIVQTRCSTVATINSVLEHVQMLAETKFRQLLISLTLNNQSEIIMSLELIYVI